LAKGVKKCELGIVRPLTVKGTKGTTKFTL